MQTVCFHSGRHKPFGNKSMREILENSIHIYTFIHEYIFISKTLNEIRV